MKVEDIEKLQDKVYDAERLVSKIERTKKEIDAVEKATDITYTVKGKDGNIMLFIGRDTTKTKVDIHILQALREELQFLEAELEIL